MNTYFERSFDKAKAEQFNARYRRSDIPHMPEVEAIRAVRARIKEAGRAQNPQVISAAQAAVSLRRQEFEEVEHRFFLGEATEEEVQKAKAAVDAAETEHRRRVVLARRSGEQMSSLYRQETMAIKAFSEAVHKRHAKDVAEMRKLLQKAAEINDRLIEAEEIARAAAGGKLFAPQSCHGLASGSVHKWLNGAK